MHKILIFFASLACVWPKTRVVKTHPLAGAARMRIIPQQDVFARDYACSADLWGCASITSTTYRRQTGESAKSG